MKTPQTTLTQETWVDVRYEVFTVMKFQVAFWVMTMWWCGRIPTCWSTLLLQTSG